MFSDILKIKGGKKLKGSIKPQGAKNEAFQVLAAVLLTEEDVFIHNLPKILDIVNLLDLFRLISVSVKDLGEGSWQFNASNVDPEKMKTDLFQQKFSELRGSLMVSGAMLARFGVGYLPEPGGDRIGVRPVTVHTRAFVDIGGEFDRENNIISLTKIDSKRITLREASVTGTANVILASVLKKGEKEHRLEIYNAACEPYIQQLCKMLNSMGAKISGSGTNLLSIEGVEKLSGTEHRLDPDMIEIGSFICMAAAVGEGVLIEGAKVSHLGEIAFYIFEKLGVTIEEKSDGLFVPKHDEINIKRPTTKAKRIRTVYDDRWPGLSPDHLSSLIAMSVHSKGMVTFKQRMFDRRLLFCDVLNTMGADTIMSHHQEVTVIGNNRSSKLTGVKMASPDIRAGMALVIAALSAEGESVINNAGQIHRGYEDIVDRLRILGADISDK
ncbi:MAG: UDP-N-acetylglucosamine 1-carboxyvinyltransferase [Candidatus Paceibacteria bacterium]|jgi:UDP-N-acetylglucosamine 1-carboxyvinyltransferase